MSKLSGSSVSGNGNVAAALASEDAEGFFKKNAVTIVRRSFEASEGGQDTQVNVLQYIVKHTLERGAVLPEAGVRARLSQRARSIRLPAGHVAIDESLREAQAIVWDANFWDIIAANRGKDASLLPSIDQLYKRVKAVGMALNLQDIWRMSSFRPNEMENMSNGFEPYRQDKKSSLTSAQVMGSLLLPSLIEVEIGWQDRSGNRHYSDGGRPGNKEDRFESTLMKNCHLAQTKQSQGRPLNPFDNLYLDISHHLDSLEPENPVYERYQALIDIYNSNHPDNPPLVNLHNLGGRQI